MEERGCPRRRRQPSGKKGEAFISLLGKRDGRLCGMSGIDYVYDECPYSVGAKTLLYKSLLNRVEEESPATKLAFMKGYLKRTRQERGGRRRRGKSPCAACAAIRRIAEECNFCRLVDRFGSERPFPFESTPLPDHEPG